MSSETNSIDQMPKKSPLSFQVDLKKFEKATDEEKKTAGCYERIGILL